MDQRRKLTTLFGLSIVVLAVAALAGGFLEGPVQAQTDEPSEDVAEAAQERVIHVSGHGEVTARPDVAVVQLGVQTEEETATEALEQNNLRMQEVISTTLQAGVAEEDVQTQGLRLNPEYSGPDEDDGQPTLTGYRAANTVAITVRDLDGLGELLDAAVEAGANTIQDIRFEVDDAAELQAQAREVAMNNALEKAEQLTALADAELGEVLTINETAGTPVPRRVVAEEAEAAGGVPIAPGMQTIEVTLQVSWRIR